MKAPDEAFPEAEIAGVGYGAIWQGQKSFNGVAILTRGDAPVLRRMGLPGEDESRALGAAVSDAGIARPA